MPKFFFTTNYLHRWSSGPIISNLNPNNGYQPIETLADAREVALSFKVDSNNKDRCDVTWGMEWSEVDECIHNYVKSAKPHNGWYHIVCSKCKDFKSEKAEDEI